MRILDQLGVLDGALAAGAVPIDRLTLVNEEVRIDAALDLDVFPAPGLCVRRITLDALLADAAAAAGAQVRTGCRVTGLLIDSARVVGVQTEQGEIQARLVVGADGRHSTVAIEVGAAEYHVSPPGRMPAWAYFSGVSDTEGRLRLGRQGELAFLASPTDGGLYMAGIAVGAATQQEFHADRDANFTAAFAAWPELADLLAGAHRVGPVRVMTDWHGYFRQSAGPGWVLVGDAGHFKDFTPAQGIADALRQAEQLTAAIVAGLDVGADLDEQTRRWWRWRDEDAYEMYWFATDMGAPGRSSPLITRILRDVGADRRATLNLLRVLNHDMAPSKLLTTRRLATAAARALRDQPKQIPATIQEINAAIHDDLTRSRLRSHPRTA